MDNRTPDSKLLTVEDISSRMAYLRKRLETEEEKTFRSPKRYETPSAFESHHKRCAALVSRIDALHIRRAKLLRAK